MVNETHIFIGLCIMLGLDILIVIALWNYDEDKIIRPDPVENETEEE